MLKTIKLNKITFVTGIWDLNIDYFIFYLVLLLLCSINYGVSPGDGSSPGDDVSHSVVSIHFRQPFSS